MSLFCCPVCGSPLAESPRAYHCPNGHDYDRAACGYVNLLQSQASSRKRHGDDRRMLTARRDFLDGGFYAPIRDVLAAAFAAASVSAAVDVGCGEGYYTAALETDCDDMAGLDVSTAALRFAARRLSRTALCCASAFHLPFADGSLDAVISVFAPCAYAEFFRVLKPAGLLFKVSPLPDHLHELREVLYETPRPNKPEQRDEERFASRKRSELRFPVALPSQKAIADLFAMTPYCYKTPADGEARLAALTSLTVTAAVAVETFGKKEL